MSNQQKPQVDKLVEKYAEWIIQAINLHPDYLPDDHELFKCQCIPYKLHEIAKRGNPKAISNLQWIEDRFKEKADAIANGNLFCVVSTLKTKEQYVELWDKIFYGLEKTLKELNTILTGVGLEPFYYYDLFPVKYTLDALVFLHGIKKYIRLEDHVVPNPIPEMILRDGGKETHIQYAKAKMKKQWLEYKERNHSLLEKELSHAEEGEKVAGRKKSDWFKEVLKDAVSQVLAHWIKLIIITIIIGIIAWTAPNLLSKIKTLLNF